MISRAKENGFFNEHEAANGSSFVTPATFDDDETMEAVDEEGNVIAGESVKIPEDETDDFLGPLGMWIQKGMNVEEELEMVGFRGNGNVEMGNENNKEIQTSVSEDSSVTKISIHTIQLPEKAPKKMLLDLKKILETFPGKEKVQLKIGEQIIPLPLTVSYSTILEKKIEEMMKRYAVSAV